MARRRRCNPKVSFMGRKRLKNGRLAKSKSPITFKVRRAKKTPSHLKKYLFKSGTARLARALAKARAKLRRNRLARRRR